jgi:predicted Zn-dependent protease
MRAWRIRFSRWPNRSWSESFVERIDGLVCGDEPRQGHVEGQTFSHPKAAFSFVVPGGWKVVNTPAQVVR